MAIFPGFQRRFSRKIRIPGQNRESTPRMIETTPREAAAKPPRSHFVFSYTKVPLDSRVPKGSQKEKEKAEPTEAALQPGAWTRPSKDSLTEPHGHIEPTKSNIPSPSNMGEG